MKMFDENGNLLVSISSMTFNTLSDVNLASEADHDMLYYDTASGKWVNGTVATILAQLSPLTTRGDMMYRNATVSTRLAKGADNTILAMGANDPEWKTPATILADLSGQAAAAFDFNSQNLTGVGTIGCGAITGGGNISLLADNRKIIFGTGSDNEIYHNGTDFVLDAGSGYVEIKTTGLGRGLRITNTQDGTAGVRFMFVHISANPAVNDDILQLYAQGVDGAGASGFNWGQIFCTINNIGDGTEASTWEFYGATAGGYNLAAHITGAGEVGGDLAYAEFDEFEGSPLDDAKLMLKSQLPALQKIGVVTPKGSGSGYMLNFQKAIYLGWGGVRQNRARIDDLDRRITQLGG